MIDIKYNVVLFCKTFINDLNRIKILKESIDKYNADKIPFCVVCPNADLDIIKKALITGREEYDILFFTDEEILSLDTDHKQNWFTQQIVKLNFHKTKICNFYIMLDSDTYFITDFYISDFMYDEKTPYLVMLNGYVNNKKRAEDNQRFEINRAIWNNERQPMYYTAVGVVFPRIVLEDFEKNYLLKNNLTYTDIINKLPYEYQWYIEWAIKSRLFDIIPIREPFREYFYHEQYLADKNRGICVDDIRAQGYLGIVMQNRWVKEEIYKPSRIYFLRKCYNNFIHLYYDEKISQNFCNAFRKGIIKPLFERYILRKKTNI